jgi:hypothetical protein
LIALRSNKIAAASPAWPGDDEEVAYPFERIVPDSTTRSLISVFVAIDVSLYACRALQQVRPFGCFSIQLLATMSATNVFAAISSPQETN